WPKKERERYKKQEALPLPNPHPNYLPHDLLKKRTITLLTRNTITLYKMRKWVFSAKFEKKFRKKIGMERRSMRK
ncbi:MAG: hypothetical protein KM296_03745, partial [Brockia lithotrophica]|nr:hypothetical protein [Brockia lithotrophica]